MSHELVEKPHEHAEPLASDWLSLTWYWHKHRVVPHHHACGECQSRLYLVLCQEQQDAHRGRIAERKCNLATDLKNIKS